MDDLISRTAAIDAVCEDGTQLERQGQYSMTMAERKQRDVDILETLPSAQPTIYGYDIGCLQFIAYLMRENGLTPEEAVTRFANYGRMA